MGFYPNMGIITTVDGKLFACNPFLSAYFRDRWDATQDTEIEFKVERNYNVSLLKIRFQDSCTIMLIRPIIRPVIRFAKWKLVLIQNAVRNWLHIRKTPPRQEAMLFLRKSILADVADAVELQLH
jgi:hypothetical protein